VVYTPRKHFVARLYRSHSSIGRITTCQWAYAYFTYQRGMRLLTGVDVEPTLAGTRCASPPTVGPFAQREDQL
jgi:hypothetical protein